jgi:hypothetical protein
MQIGRGGDSVFRKGGGVGEEVAGCAEVEVGVDIGGNLELRTERGEGGSFFLGSICAGRTLSEGRSP